MIVEPLQKALGNRPNITLDILPMNRDNCIVLLEQNKRFLAWFEDFTRKFAAYRAELELPVGEWLTKNAKTTKDIIFTYALGGNVGVSESVAHKKWVSVDEIQPHLMKLVSDKTVAEEKNTEYAKLVAGQAKEYAEKLQDKVLVDRRQLSDRAVRLLQLRAGGRYMMFEAGMFYQILLTLGFKDSRHGKIGEQEKSLENMVCHFPTEKDAREKLKELLAGSEKENLNLALAFSDVRKKKGSGSENPK